MKMETMEVVKTVVPILDEYTVEIRPRYYWRGILQTTLSSKISF